MKFAEGLDYILKTPPYFSSHNLLLHWIVKCENYIKRVEESLKSESVSKLISSLTRNDLAFLVRSTSFRLLIKDIERELHSDSVSIRSIQNSYADLEILFIVLRTAIQLSENGELVSKDTLTGPYPLCVDNLKGVNLFSRFESTPVLELFTFSNHLLQNQYSISDFTEKEIVAIKRSLGNLNSLSPYILFDVSMNVRHFCKIAPILQNNKSQHISLTTTYLPGTSFFSEGMFSSAEMIAESIFHESLHMKYIQTLEIHYLHRTTYHGTTGRNFICPWREAGNNWKFNRAFGAYHVYAHLVLYYHAMLEGALPDGYDAAWIARRAGECRERESVLREYVAAEEEYAFTNEGIAFWRTIADTVDQCMAGT